MKIIGEKINGTRKSVAEAIAKRDAQYIQGLAHKQAEAGATWLDVNAGSQQDREGEDLVWLIDIIQRVTDIPLCIDSASPKALQTAIQAVKKPPLINSVTGAPDRMEQVLSLAAEHGCDLIALAMDGEQIPQTVDKRIEIVDRILETSRRKGIPDSKLYIDPLTMTIATFEQSAIIACETLCAVQARYPLTHLVMGLSNISYGLPSRKQINRTMLILAMQAGLDCVILDPLDKELRSAIITTELLLGRDRHCLNYIKASRSGLFDDLAAKTG